jgi:hypothetical protein
MAKKKSNYLLIGIVVLIAAVAAYTLNAPFGELSCPFARPYFGSINCEKVDSPRTITVGGGDEYSFYNSQTPGHSDKLDPVFMSIRNADFPMPDCDWTALFSSVRFEEATENSNTWYPKIQCDGTTSLFACKEKFSDASGTALDSSKKYRVRAYCSYVSGEELAYNQYDYNWNLRFNDEAFFYYKDSTGGVAIPNTEGCKYNDLYAAYYQNAQKNQPASKVAWNSLLASMPIINSLFGREYTPGTSNVDVPIDAYAGQSYLYVQEWVERPDINVKRHDGKQVYCNSDGANSALYEISSLTTGGGCYSIPHTYIKNVECCEDTTCQLKYDASYTCDETGSSATFTCKKTEDTGCNSDFDCGSQQTVCKQSSNKYYTIGGSKCLSGKCMPPEKTEVECCTGLDGGPAICGSGWCDYEKGCQSTKKACPEGKWCIESEGCSYFRQDCEAGLKKCPGTCSGNCKVSCESGCTANEQCNDGDEDTIDKCVKDLFGNGVCQYTEKGTSEACVESCGITNVECIADCWTRSLTSKLVGAMQSGGKFILAVFIAIAATLFLDMGVTKNIKKKKDKWKGTVASLFGGLITFIIMVML